MSDNAPRHEGVVYGISHPGPIQLGCPYCIDTLRLGYVFPELAADGT